MKRSLSIFPALMLALPIAALAQGTLKIGTVDMQKAFKDYNKTKEAEVKINDAKNAAKKEYDDRAEAYKKTLDEVNNLNKQLESPALSADKKTGMANESKAQFSIGDQCGSVNFAGTRRDHRAPNQPAKLAGTSAKSGISYAGF